METIVKKEIINILGNNSKGLSITELVAISGYSRSLMRIALAMLEGAGEISFRQTGMTKLYYLTEEDQDEKNK